MIEVTIDCPFSVGDTVYVKKTRDEYHKIECPFCHGKSIYNTGLMHTIIPRSLMYRPGDESEEPWVLTCKTCDGTGEVEELARHVDVWEKGIVKGIAELHGGGWRWIDYDVEFTQEDGSTMTRIVQGSSIYTEVEQKNYD